MKKWEVVSKLKIKNEKLKMEDIMNVLLENRGLKTKKEKEEFFNPKDPEEISLTSLGIKESEVKKAVERIKKTKKKKEKVIVYGDYDADGICATAILWETLHTMDLDILPYIPERFSEGYGLNVESVQKLKIENEKLKVIITVDNGIVANDAVEAANKLGIDVIITDHHQLGKKLPSAYSIIHTDKISGSGISWIIAREIVKSLKLKVKSSIELAAIGTIADQLPLTGPNRSFAKFGLGALNDTNRLGLQALFEEAGIGKVEDTRLRTASARQVGTYEVNFAIAPRLNAMGRLVHAIDSLRILCTTSKERAKDLSFVLGKTNRQRQKMLEEVVLHAKEAVGKKRWKGIILIAHESYHEGIIGLAASKLVEEFWRPAIVVSKGKEFSKGSARSIPGFNIIEIIRKADDLLVGAGGHPMAAGFTIETKNLEGFAKKMEIVSDPLLTDEVLIKRLMIDLEIEFDQINYNFLEKLMTFEPTGIGNFRPTFATQDVSISDVHLVGREGKHLKLYLEKDGINFAAIAFGMGELHKSLSPDRKVDIAYTIERDEWNGNNRLQLKIRDIKV